MKKKKIKNILETVSDVTLFYWVDGGQTYFIIHHACTFVYSEGGPTNREIRKKSLKKTRIVNRSIS